MDPVQLEKRLEALEAAQDIINMHNDYLFYLNERRWRDMADCFTEDAVADIHEKIQGREKIYEHFANVISKLNTGERQDLHFAVQPVIKADGDKATGHWLMYIFVPDEKGNALRWIPGRYDCEYAKVAGQWKFSSMKYTVPWPH